MLGLLLFRDDMVVLREETDITKVNSKLAILEQQQEVINCEEKLKLLLETMADFLLKLKKTNSRKLIVHNSAFLGHCLC